MTLNEIELDVYRRLDYADTPPTSVKSRIDGFINQRYRALLSTDRMRRFRMGSTDLNVTAGLAEYALSSALGRITCITDLLNRFVLDTRTPEWYREADPTAMSRTVMTGTPSAWVPLGWSPIIRSPLLAVGPTANLYLASDVNNDVMSYEVIYTSYPDGLVRTITGNGTSQTGIPITITTSPNQVADIISVRLTSDRTPGPLIGNVTLAGVAFASIPPASLYSIIQAGKTMSRFYRFALTPMPSTSNIAQYSIEYEHELPQLVSPTDTPNLPTEFHDLLCLMARADEYEFKSDDRFGPLQVQIMKRTMELRQWADNHDAQRRYAVPDNGPSTSRLGPYFPAGT